ncbi:MAG: SIS domain-containing protein [Spirochaetes bacterium]|nr:SIS domain-containing protein [Spirochaetota bacterium]
MKNVQVYADKLFADYPALAVIKPDFQKAFELLRDTYTRGSKVLLCGNGGSYSDSAHFAGELMKSFIKKRPLAASLVEKLHARGERGARMSQQLEAALCALPLPGNNAFASAYLNDANPEFVYAQALLGMGRAGDTLVGFSTSGNAKNVLAAMELAKALDIHTLGISGRDGGDLKRLADVCIIVPATETYKIQEFHLPVYHTLALMLEEEFF